MVLAEQSTLERLEAIQRHLNRSGSVDGFAVAVLVIALILIVVVILHRAQSRRQRHDVDKPGKLFRKLVRELDLSVPQRDLLRRIGLDLRLENAAVLLLGRPVFEAHAKRWSETQRSRRSDDQRRLVELADALFAPREGKAITASSGSATPRTDD